MNAYGYLFQGCNIGPDGVLNDGLNVPEILSAIQKKYLGNANIVIDSAPTDVLYGGNVQSSTPNAFSHVHQTKIFSQIVPVFNKYYYSNLSVLQKVNEWSNYNYYAFNTTMSNDSESSKYILPDYPYIVYYDKLLLTCIGYDDNNGLYSELDTSYTHPLLQGLISDSYDITYSYFLLGIDKDSSTKSLIIEKNNGSWILDNDAGVLTFYDRIDTATTVKQVSRSNAPRISFYRYEGLYGEANILNGQDL